jgi:hypothetical protein
MELRYGPVYALADHIYRESDALSVSGVKALSISAAHFQNSLTQTKKKTPALTFGSAFHARVLEPEIYAERYVAKELNLRTNLGRAERDEMEANGVTILSPEDGEAVEGMARAIEAHPIASVLFSGGESEVSWFWKCPRTGVKKKARTDYWRKDINTIVDLKTTELATKSEIQRAMRTYKYRWQADYYSDGVAQCLGVPQSNINFTFVFIEKKPPYGIRIITATAETNAPARVQYEPHVLQYAECKATGVWPAYPAVIETDELTHWELRDVA